MKINWKKLLLFIIGTIIIGSIFAFLTMNNTFETLNKPFDIPKIVFPIVWTILYTLMGISLYIISETETKQDIKKKACIAYTIQLVINSLWTLIFFGLKAYFFAFLWQLFLLVFILLMIVLFYIINKKAGLLQIPYILWVLFASYLNFMIFLLN